MAAESTYYAPSQGTPNTYENTLSEHRIAWVDGATAGTIPNEDIPINYGNGGHIAAIGVKFSIVTIPNTITVTISDSHGIPICSGTLTATGRIDLSSPVPYVGVLTVAHSGNTTVNALGDTYIITF